MFILRKRFEEELEKAKREMYAEQERERQFKVLDARIDRLFDRMFKTEARVEELRMMCRENNAKEEFEAAMAAKGEV